MRKAHKILFLDPLAITEAHNVTLKAVAPAKRTIVLENDKPWESIFIAFYTTYLFDQGMHKLFYTVHDLDHRRHLAYAESSDGENWYKPSLGLVQYHGTKDNNLLAVDSLEGTVCLNPDPASDERYLYLCHHLHEGLALHTSPDGFSWTRKQFSASPFFCDSQNVAFFDPRKNKYAVYLRGWEPRQGQVDQLYRTVRYCETDSLASLPPVSQEHAVYRTCGDDISERVICHEYQPIMVADERDGADTDIYTLAAQPYPNGEPYYIGFPTFYTHDDSRYRNDGVIHTQFAASTDGLHWHRYDRAVIIGNETEGSFRNQMAFVNPGMIDTGDAFRYYGTIYHTKHGEDNERRLVPDGKIVAYEQRKDGFVCAAFAQNGELTTDLLHAHGKAIVCNAQIGANGHLRCELLDAEGNVIPDFRQELCVPISGDGQKLPVFWKQDHPAGLPEVPFRIHVCGSDARLFSLEIL